MPDAQVADGTPLLNPLSSICLALRLHAGYECCPPLWKSDSRSSFSFAPKPESLWNVTPFLVRLCCRLQALIGAAHVVIPSCLRELAAEVFHHT